MSWIKYRTDLCKAPETMCIARLTKLDRFSVGGRLACVWAWAQDLTVTGRVTPCTADDIDAVAEHPGFAESMQKAGWLEIGEGFVNFPDWKKHNGLGAKQRAQSAVRQQSFRDKKRNAPVTQGALLQRDGTPVPRNAPVTQVTHQEQSREEKKRAEAENRRGTETNPPAPAGAAPSVSVPSGSGSLPLPEQMRVADRGKARRLLEGLEWPSDNPGDSETKLDRLHRKTITAILEREDFSLIRVFTLVHRAKTEAKNPARWITAALADWWAITADDEKAFRQWETEQAGSALSKLEGLRRQHKAIVGTIGRVVEA